MTDQEIVRAVAEKVMNYDLDTFNCCFFNPLTNLNHAFQVVEKMREDGWHFHCDWVGWVEEFTVQFWKENPNDLTGCECNLNLGTAICLAAIKAKGVEI